MPPPGEDDDLILDTFIDRMTTYAAVGLEPISASIKNRYELYRLRRGNPWDVDEEPAFDPYKQYFHDVYEGAPSGFAFIGKLRSSMGGTCPMCGGTGNGSLDHYLPKDKYPEFSFFSPNLVPCCTRCNPLRGAAVKGERRDSRPLHPYFDPIVAQNLVEIAVLPDYATPKFEPRLLLAHDHTSYDALAWHVKNVMLRAHFVEHCEYLWGRLIAKPLTLCGRTPTVEAIRAKFDEHIELDLAVNQSPNGWSTCFYSGVRKNLQAVQFLCAHLAAKMADADHSEKTGWERLMHVNARQGQGPAAAEVGHEMESSNGRTYSEVAK